MPSSRFLSGPERLHTGAARRAFPYHARLSLTEHVGKTTLTMVFMLSIGLGHTFPHEHGDYLGYPWFWDNTVYEKTRKKSLTISGWWIFIWLDKCQERLTKGSTCLLSYFLGERDVQNVIVHETQQRKTPPIAQTIMYLQYGCDFILCLMVRKCSFRRGKSSFSCPKNM